MGKKRLTYTFVKNQFEIDGYELLSTNYINCGTKLRYKCPEGHIHSISWDNWKKGHRCPYCDGQAKPTTEFVRKSFEDSGYKLLTTVYINSDSHLDYICPKGHKHSMKWNNWRIGRRCPSCKGINHSKRISGEKHYNWQGGITCEPYCFEWNFKEFKEFIKERDGYKCLNPSCWNISNRLCIHHIDYNKKNCELRNLITLCNSCNARANTDRKWHKSWYGVIIYRRYYYNCDIFKQIFFKKGELRIMSDGRIFGEVKWFSNERGYGFVVDEADPQSEYFAHFSYVTMDGYKTLKQGQKVSFELVETDRGLQAQEILVEGE